VPKFRPPLTDTYADVRSYPVSDWARSQSPLPPFCSPAGDIIQRSRWPRPSRRRRTDERSQRLTDRNAPPVLGDTSPYRAAKPQEVGRPQPELLLRISPPVLTCATPRNKFGHPQRVGLFQARIAPPRRRYRHLRARVFHGTSVRYSAGRIRGPAASIQIPRDRPAAGLRTPAAQEGFGRARLWKLNRNHYFVAGVVVLALGISFLCATSYVLTSPLRGS